jgi:hypothetical protein
MTPSEPNRRDFTKLAAAALGGLVAGTAVAAEDKKDDKKDKTKNPFLSEPHVCRGLNTCKGKGKGGKNNCAGSSACATVKAHTCKGENDCRGQGGCGAKPGENECKGMGDCAVPLSAKVWPKARKRFEEVMAKAKIKVLPAPKP